MQIGVTPFIWNEEQKKYVAKPFNFSVMKNITLGETVYYMDPGHMIILSDQEFRFNKLLA